MTGQFMYRGMKSIFLYEEMQLPDNNTYYDITIDNKLENVVKNDATDLAVDALMRAIGDYAFEENINSFSFQKLP